MECLATPPSVTHSPPFQELPVVADVFRIAFEQAAAGISISGPTAEYIHANSAFCEFVGYSLDELRRLTAYDLMHPDDRRRATETQVRMLDGEMLEARWERRYIHKSGLSLWGL